MPNQQIIHPQKNKQQDSYIDINKISPFQLQNFVIQFKKSSQEYKRFFLIQQEFIKKYRFKNFIQQQQTLNIKSLFKQFLKAYKETMRYFDSYHQYVQNSLDKFSFCKDLNKFIKDLYYSEQKITQFFLTQLQFHQAFIQENQMKFKTKIQSFNEICSQCKENKLLKGFQNLKQNISYQFQDHFNLYKKDKVASLLGQESMNAKKHLENIFNLGQQLSRQNQQNSGNINSKLFPLNQYDISLAQMRLNKVLNESKKQNENPLQEIFDMFNTKEQQDFNSINRSKVNEMFYELQCQLDNRSHQIEEYIGDLLSFNDRLINYNPNITKNGQNNYYDQTQPGIVQNQMKLNFKKIIKKIYQKVTQIIKNRKQTAVSVQTQVNFSQDNIIKQLQKQKKKLTMQLKKCQQDKTFLTNNLKQENEKLKKQITRLNEQKIKFEITKDQALADKNSLQKQHDKMIRAIDQMKREIQRVTYLLEREKKMSNMTKSGGRRVAITRQYNQGNNEGNQEGLIKNNSSFVGQNQGKGLENGSKVSNQMNKELTQEEKDFMDELDRNQRQLIKNLAKRRAKSKKKFMAPRRSKLIQTIKIQESSLGQHVSRFSKTVDKHDFGALKDEDNKSESNSFSTSKRSQQISQVNKTSCLDLQHQQQQQNSNDTKSVQQRQLTIGLNIIEKNQNGQNQKTFKSLKTKKVLIKNHKSKTFTQIKNGLMKKQAYNENHGKSSKQISQTSEDIQKQLEQLQKIKKMKELEIKLANMSKNDNREKSSKDNKGLKRSTIGFNIQKQIDQSIKVPKQVESLPKPRQESKSLIHTNNSNNSYSLISNIKLSKQDLTKKFSKNKNDQQLPTSKKFGKALQTINQPRRSSISVTSKGYLALIDQIYKQIQQNRTHIGIQTNFIQDQILKMLYKQQLTNRKWNDLILTFDAFKFGYEQFVSQLSSLIGKQEKNPIRKLNQFKGSSSLLKKSHNYRFNKENLGFGKSDGMSNQHNFGLENKASIQRQYFVPRSINDRFDNGKNQMNQTMGNFSSGSNHMNDISYFSVKPMNCATISDFKNLSNLINGPLGNKHEAQANKDFKKKGFYTLHHVKTENTNEINVISEKDQYRNNQKGAQNNQDNTKIIRFPSFEKEDAQNLFFSIESAKLFEEKIQNSQSNFMALQPTQIHFSTQFLAILAQVHLIEGKIYNQIKNVLLYPVKVLNAAFTISYNATSTGFYNPNSSSNQPFPPGQTSSQIVQMSLKKGLGYIIQLHRKCKPDKQKIGGGQSQQRTGVRLKSSSKQKMLVNSSQIIKRKPLCSHLMNFKKKMIQVLRVHNKLPKINN